MEFFTIKGQKIRLAREGRSILTQPRIDGRLGHVRLFFRLGFIVDLNTVVSALDNAKPTPSGEAWETCIGGHRLVFTFLEDTGISVIFELLGGDLD